MINIQKTLVIIFILFSLLGLSMSAEPNNITFDQELFSNPQYKEYHAYLIQKKNLYSFATVNFQDQNNYSIQAGTNHETSVSDSLGKVRGKFDRSCPATTHSCIPCAISETYCRAPAGESYGYLGWSCQNNNPGNIRFSTMRRDMIKQYAGPEACGEKGSFMIFKTYEDGRNALEAYIRGIADGAHFAYPSCGACSLREFFSIYAPAADQNNPDSYSEIVASRIGIDADNYSLNWVVDNKLIEFIDAVQEHEGWFED